MSVHRRLSALFFADIVGCSGLSARDEARALRLVPVFQAATRDVVAAMARSVQPGRSSCGSKRRAVGGCRRTRRQS
jgi:hypothetical protein